MNRRDFLICGGGAVLLGGVGTGSVSEAETLIQDIKAPVDGGGWEALLDHNFKLYPKHGSRLDMTLISVEKRAAASAQSGSRLEQFSLTFLGHGHELTEGSYVMTHPRVNPFLLYLQPVGGAARHAHYRADFNLLT